MKQSISISLLTVSIMVFFALGCATKNRGEVVNPFENDEQGGSTDEDSQNNDPSNPEDNAIQLKIGINKIEDAYVDGGADLNRFEGEVSSGVGITSLSYAMKVNGQYGEEHEVSVGSTPTDFDFLIEFDPEVGTEAVRVSATNGEVTEEKELVIENLHRKLLRFTDITLTNEIGNGKDNWFAAWQEPHVFSVSEAKEHQEMMDFAMITRLGTRLAPGVLALTSETEGDRFAPYLDGFTKVTYCMVTGNRASVNSVSGSDVENLIWDSDMEDLVFDHFINIQTPYDIRVQNRRVSDEPVEGQVYMLGWGSFQDGKAENEAFGLIRITGTETYTVDDEEYKRATMDVVVPAEDMRTKYKSTQTYDY